MSGILIQFVEKDGSIIFSVRVVPKSSKSEVVGERGGALKVKLKSPPVDGAANAELIKTLAKFFNAPQSAVEILKGQTSKNKRIKISGLSGLNAASLPDVKSA